MVILYFMTSIFNQTLNSMVFIMSSVDFLSIYADLLDLGIEDIKKWTGLQLNALDKLTLVYFSFSVLLYMNITKKAMSQGSLFE